jgi:dihydroxyacetone synthase
VINPKKPTSINIRITIGYETSTAGTFKSHHGTYSDADAALFADSVDATTHTVSEQGKAHFSWGAKQGRKLEQEWNSRVELYHKQCCQSSQPADQR